MRNKKIEFREATASDACVIAELHTQSWRNTYRGILRDAYLDGDILTERLDMWRMRLGASAQEQFCLIAYGDQRPIGFVFLEGHADPQWGTLLDNLHVLPAAQGNGLGTQLIHRAATWVRNRFPDDGMFLWVFEGNILARRFYENLNPRIVERIVAEAPGGGRIGEWRYAWPDIENLLRVTRRHEQ